MPFKDQEFLQKRILKTFIRIMTGAVSVLLVIFCAVFLFQDKLIFYPQTISQETLNQISRLGEEVQEIRIKTEDNTELGGWYINKEHEKLLIYFGGNSEEVSKNIDTMKHYTDWSIALMYYRGYGSSEGNPGEEYFYQDALEIYDYFTSGTGKHYSQIVVMGRSIGTGVATYLADKRELAGVVLVTPYDSLTSVLKKKIPLIPIDALLKHDFDSIGRAPKINLPVLMLVAAEDKIIPPYHAQRLAEAWGGKVVLKIFPGEGHNSISKNEESWRIIGNFLDAL